MYYYIYFVLLHCCVVPTISDDRLVFDKHYVSLWTSYFKNVVSCSITRDYFLQEFSEVSTPSPLNSLERDWNTAWFEFFRMIWSEKRLLSNYTVGVPNALHTSISKVRALLCSRNTLFGMMPLRCRTWPVWLKRKLLVQLLYIVKEQNI